VVGETGEDPAGPAGKTKDKIVSFLDARRNTAYEAVELHNEIGGSYDSVRRAAARLAADGIISKKSLNKRGTQGYFIPGEVNQPEEEEGLVQLGSFSLQKPDRLPDDESDNKCDRVLVESEKRDRICDNQIEPDLGENLGEEIAANTDRTDITANSPSEPPETADHFADHAQKSDRQKCPAGNPLSESVSPLPIAYGAKNSKIDDEEKSDFWQQTRSANVEAAPSATSQLGIVADHFADRVLDDQQNDQQTRPVHEEEVWQVGDRVSIKSVPPKQPKSFVGKIGVVEALSMTGLRVKVGKESITLDPENVQRCFISEKTEAPGAPQPRRYKGNVRPKIGDLLTSGTGKQGIVTAINNSTAAKYEVTWSDNKKAGYAFDDFELLEITYERH
jgi:hypothetical protein